ncbi:hypothetical protein LT493_08445 [Streptomyces tricolor]|nr:hypothetical protein [Streptomyces tricolor]
MTCAKNGSRPSPSSRRPGAVPGLAGGHGQPQAAHPQGQQEFEDAVEDLHAVGEPVALADEGLLHLQRQPHESA